MSILVVDDQRINREIIADILEYENWSVIQASNGQEAVDLYKELSRGIAMVLMDISMPVMDGYEAATLIKQHAGSHHVPILFITGAEEDEVLAKCLEAGGDDFIAKPVQENTLIAKLKVHQRLLDLNRELNSKNESLAGYQLATRREHDIVDKIFKNSMKRMDLDIENVEFRLSPMSMFNGDMLLVAPSPSGGCYVLLGDFTGHGLAAALGCMPVSDIFYAMTAKQSSVGKIAMEVNRRLSNVLPPNMFFCAAFVELSAAGDRLNIWSGGMNDMLLMGEDGEIVKKIQSQHMPLGILDSQEFDIDVTVMTPPENSRLLIYTDGVIEAENPIGELFGEELFEQVVCAENGNYIDRIFYAVEAFTGGHEQNDDIAVADILCREVTFGEGHDEYLKELKNSNQSGFSWNSVIKLDPDHLRQDDNPASILAILTGVPGIRRHRDYLLTIVTELYSNALEHGVLGLESSLKASPEGFGEYYSERNTRLENLEDGEVFVQISVEYLDNDDSRIRIRFTDTGKGFDFEAVNARDSDDDEASGRGIMLMRSLCESVTYSNRGRTVEIEYMVD